VPTLSPVRRNARELGVLASPLAELKQGVDLAGWASLMGADQTERRSLIE